MNGGYQATISASDAPPWALTIALDEDNLKLCHTWPVHGPGEGGGGEGWGRGGGVGAETKEAFFKQEWKEVCSIFPDRMFWYGLVDTMDYEISL